MEIETFKSFETGREEIFIRFNKHDKKSLISAAKRRISDCKRMEQRVHNNPRNEGQVDYIERAKELVHEQEFLQELIDLFTKNPK